MIINYKSILLFGLILFFFLGCEYERIEATKTECDSDPIELTLESVQNTLCAESSGEIVVTADSEYEYRLNDNEFVSNNVFSGLSAGVYNVQARVVNTNCVSEVIEATINNEDGLQISLIEKSDSECGENTGRLVVSQEGGVEPIEYVLNGTEVQNEPIFTDLASGDYNVVVRDANGCEAEISGVKIMTSVSFSNDIKTIIATNCAVSGCHNGSQSPNLTEDANILQNASRIKARTGNRSMPPTGREDLTDQEIQTIACWVDGGALDN